MNDGSRILPAPQIFGGPGHGSPFLIPSEPGEPERAPPRPSPADAAVRALVTLTPLVRGELRREGVPERDVPNVAQTVLFDVLPWWTAQWHSSEPRAKGELAAYVRVAARHAAGHFCRKASRRREILGREPELSVVLEVPSAALSPEEALFEARARRQRADFLSPRSLDRILGRPLWHIFREYAVLELPVKWIAEGNGLPVPTIYNCIRIARDLLRAELRRRRAALRSR